MNSLFGCWEWSGAKDPRGYGRVNRRTYGSSLAHRVVYEVLIGPIPDGLVIDHLCRNPSCYNPVHMEPVLQRENVLRGVGLAKQKAAQTHCCRGHLLDETNTFRHSKTGTRGCRTCHRERQQKRRMLNSGTTYEPEVPS